jgi:hypothetical protein
METSSSLGRQTPNVNIPIEVIPAQNYGTLRRLFRGGSRATLQSKSPESRMLSASMMQLAGESSVKVRGLTSTINSHAMLFSCILAL